MSTEKVIGIIGGTGHEGKALAKNWAASGLQVVIGSRDMGRAQQTADELNERGKADFDNTFRPIRGQSNEEAIKQADYVVLSLPHEVRNETIGEFKQLLRDKIIVDLTVPLAPGKPPGYKTSDAGSSAQELSRFLEQTFNLVSGFHTLGAGFLEKLYQSRAAGTEPEEDQDVFICGDGQEIKQQVLDDLVGGLHMRGIDAGSLDTAQTLERLVPLLIGLNIRYKRKSTGIKITGF